MEKFIFFVRTGVSDDHDRTTPSKVVPCRSVGIVFSLYFQGGCLIIDAKGVFDAIHRSESAALSMQDKRSAVEGLALREGIGRTKTSLRWCHSEANVADALTKLDNRAHEMLRKFLQSKVWRIVWDSDFTSSKKLKQQKKGKPSRTS